MIINKDNNGAAEMARLTGSYYANSDFSNVEMDFKQAEEELKQVIGDSVFDKAEKLYQQGASSAEDEKLVELVQRPVAIRAALLYFKKNDVSHEDTGRKVKLSSDDTDKIPWEWQLDRDNEAHLEAYYAAVEILIRYLNKAKITEWIQSDRYKMSRTLLIRSGAQFDNYYPINRSERFFFLLLPFIREAQVQYLKPQYGKDWTVLLEEDSIPETDIHFAACKACALLAMSIALRRLPLALIPSGVIRSYRAEQSGENSRPASMDEIITVTTWIENDATIWLERMKDIRDDTDMSNFDLFPKNDPKNKFFRT